MDAHTFSGPTNSFACARMHTTTRTGSNATAMPRTLFSDRNASSMNASRPASPKVDSECCSIREANKRGHCDSFNKSKSMRASSDACRAGDMAPAVSRDGLGTHAVTENNLSSIPSASQWKTSCNEAMYVIVCRDIVKSLASSPQQSTQTL